MNEMLDKQRVTPQSDRIDAVIFDGSGVMFRPSWTLSARDHFGEAVKQSAIENAFRLSYGEPDHPLSLWERGQCSFEKVRELLAQSSDSVTIDWATLQMTVHTPQMFTSMVSLICELNDRGYGTAIVTNTMHEFSVINDSCSELQGLTEHWIRSCDVGFRKPEQEIYEEALRRLGDFLPEHVLFVDDTPICVEGAARLGMQTLLVSDAHTAAAEIRDKVLL